MSWYLNGRRVYALDLRYVLTIILVEARCPLTIGELVARLEHDGFEIRGRPSKTVSDALRWEVSRGRVIRRSRGLYEAGTMPRQTRSHIRRRVQRLRHAVGIESWPAVA